MTQSLSSKKARINKLVHKIVIASDHAGVELKSILKKYLSESHFEVTDVGSDSQDSVDYPDYAIKACSMLAKAQQDRAILICGSGVGMCITANKFRGIRAVVASDNETAQLARAHNDTNVLCLAARKISHQMAEQIVSTWLNTEFEGGRHLKRLDKIRHIEDENSQKE